MMHGLTKIEVAVAQLRLSIALFMEECEHISVITLAGAAEQILGKIAASASSTPSPSQKDSAQNLAIW